jgi:hypothetical protein
MGTGSAVSQRWGTVGSGSTNSHSGNGIAPAFGALPIQGFSTSLDFAKLSQNQSANFVPHFVFQNLQSNF